MCTKIAKQDGKSLLIYLAAESGYFGQVVDAAVADVLLMPKLMNMPTPAADAASKLNTAYVSTTAVVAAFFCC